MITGSRVSAGHAAPALRSTCLLDADPDFARAVPGDQQQAARRALVLPRVDVPRGPFDVPQQGRWRLRSLGLLVSAGLVAVDVMLGDRTATQLAGPGDVLMPWGGAGELLPCRSGWRMMVPTSLVLLDSRFVTAGTRWPGLTTLVHRRLVQQLERGAAQAVVSHLPRVEDRVLATMWHLAERFGRVSQEGVLVPLPLTHKLIGQLVGAQRPTVTLALSQLAAAGDLSRRGDGTWLLRSGSRRRFTGQERAAAPASVAEQEAPVHAVA